MIKEFCTNINTIENIQEVISSLKNYLPDPKITVDLTDINQALRIEASFLGLLI